jgi:hypothetical protein
LLIDQHKRIRLQKSSNGIFVFVVVVVGGSGGGGEGGGIAEMFHMKVEFI